MSAKDQARYKAANPEKVAAAMDFEPSMLEWQLNQLGAEGWELAAAIGSCWYIFKREVVA